MIRIACPPGSEEIENIVISAFERSCGVGSTQGVSYPELINAETARLQANSKYVILVLVSPPEECSTFLISALEKTMAKVIVFGVVPPLLAQFLSMQVHPISPKVLAASECSPAPINQFSESVGYIKYIKGLDGSCKAPPSRALRRYDYADEWNNLGYGAITADGSIWSLSRCAHILRQNALSYLMIHEEEFSVYCGLWDYPLASLLWFNREVGPIDSYEWRLIEIYISRYRFDDLPAWPILLEIPYGYEGAVTMRLDCDEDVESARALYNAYKEWGVPFSLALHAKVLSDTRHHQLPQEIMANGGAILSHTFTHTPNWGGSQEAALYEGIESSKIINLFTSITPQYAVSPFHQTPMYARLGLAQAGYQGCIGGIIANDPEFIMARGGRPPFSAPGFIGHTQQCMIHGDCLLKSGDPLNIYKRAFDHSFGSKTLYGYLDHPFSERYQYGWVREGDRIEVHRLFVDYMRSRSNHLLFLNENDALDFIYAKSYVHVEEVNGEIKISAPLSPSSGLVLAVEYGHITYGLDSLDLIV